MYRFCYLDVSLTDVYSFHAPFLFQLLPGQGQLAVFGKVEKLPIK